jgi:hypothetical protein
VYEQELNKMEGRMRRKYERIIDILRKIRTSAKAVIIQNGKLLAIKLNDGKEEWYILSGGGQDCEEMPQM